MDELSRLKSDLAQLACLALFGESEDVWHFVARLARQYRTEDPVLTSHSNPS